MIFKSILINLFLIFSTFAQSDLPKEKTIDVVSGLDKIITVDFNPSTKVGNSNQSVLDYTIVPVKKEIIFKGLNCF